MRPKAAFESTSSRVNLLYLLSNSLIKLVNLVLSNLTKINRNSNVKHWSITITSLVITPNHSKKLININ
jgi:hypothetical protein